MSSLIELRCLLQARLRAHTVRPGCASGVLAGTAECQRLPRNASHPQEANFNAEYRTVLAVMDARCLRVPPRKSRLSAFAERRRQTSKNQWLSHGIQFRKAPAVAMARSAPTQTRHPSGYIRMTPGSKSEFLNHSPQDPGSSSTPAPVHGVASAQTANSMKVRIRSVAVGGCGVCRSGGRSRSALSGQSESPRAFQARSS